MGISIRMMMNVAIEIWEREEEEDECVKTRG